MTIRAATEADEPTLHALFDEFVAEVPFPIVAWRDTWAEQWADTLANIRAGGVFVADDAHGASGVASIELKERGRAHLHLVYVRPRARRGGVAKELVHACVEHAKSGGATTVSLNVQTDNETARVVWRRLGFAEYSSSLATSLDALEARLDDEHSRDSHASTHVQSDDRTSIDRAVAAFVPRLRDPQVTQSANGWTRIADSVLDADRDAQRRLARELSERLGSVVVALALENAEVVRFLLHERGRMVDEYLSVPSYYGPISKADELALAANPTLAARLTGADPTEVRRVARTAASTADLPAGQELYAQVAAVLGLEP